MIVGREADRTWWTTIIRRSMSSHARVIYRRLCRAHKGGRLSTRTSAPPVTRSLLRGKWRRPGKRLQRLQRLGYNIVSRQIETGTDRHASKHPEREGDRQRKSTKTTSLLTNICKDHHVCLQCSILMLCCSVYFKVYYVCLFIYMQLWKRVYRVIDLCMHEGPEYGTLSRHSSFSFAHC